MSGRSQSRRRLVRPPGSAFATACGCGYIVFCSLATTAAIGGQISRRRRKQVIRRIEHPRCPWSSSASGGRASRRRTAIRSARCWSTSTRPVKGPARPLPPPAPPASPRGSRRRLRARASCPRGSSGSCGKTESPPASYASATMSLWRCLALTSHRALDLIADRRHQLRIAQHRDQLRIRRQRIQVSSLLLAFAGLIVVVPVCLAIMVADDQAADEAIWPQLKLAGLAAAIVALASVGYRVWLIIRRERGRRS